MGARDRRQYVALVPHRLCTSKRRGFSADLHAPLDAALTWQQMGVRADFWGMAGTPILHGPERMFEIGGLMAAAGEQLGLACLADHEVGCLRIPEVFVHRFWRIPYSGSGGFRTPGRGPRVR